MLALPGLGTDFGSRPCPVGARPKVNRDLSIRRLRARIDRALDVGNQAQFVELCGLLRDYQGSRAPETP